MPNIAMFPTARKLPFQTDGNVAVVDTSGSIRSELLTEVPKLYKDIELSYVPRREGTAEVEKANNNDGDDRINSMSIPIHKLSLRDSDNSTDKIGTEADNDNGFFSWKRMRGRVSSKNRNGMEPKQSKSKNPEMVTNNTDTDLSKLGNFENPVLEKLVKRSINKELEFRKLVVNIVSLSLWNLTVKFTNYFINYTDMGQELLLQLRVYMLALIRKLNQSGITLLKYQNWAVLSASLCDFEHINLVVHLVVLYNLLVASWRLFSSIKTSDLNLNSKQRRLLGLDPIDQSASSMETKNHWGARNSGGYRRVNKVAELPRTPFLFKQSNLPDSMDIPEVSEIVDGGDIKPRKDTFGTGQQSAISLIGNHNGSNGSLNSDVNRDVGFSGYMGNKTQRTGYNVGYIPSEKYTYMMGSPRIAH